MSQEWRITLRLGLVFTVLISTLSINAQSQGQSVQPLLHARQLTKVSDRASDIVSVERIETHYKLLGSAFDDPILLNNLGVRYSILSRHEKALELIEIAARLAPESTSILLNLAIIKIELGQLSSALESVEQLRTLDPTNVRIDAILCDLLTGTLRHGEAVECFERRLKSSTLDSASASNYSQSLIFEGRSEEALPILRKVWTEHPNNKAIMNGLGMALYKTKKFSDAAEVLGLLVKADPDQGEYRYNLAMVQLALNQRAVALQNYAILKRAQPELAQGLYKEIFRSRLIDVSQR